MLKRFMADLHIHTCLSPCGDLSMTPQKIVAQAIAKKLNIIAISDHNSAENVSAVTNVANKNNLTVIPAMEICSKEEVHLLSLFENIESAFLMQEIVYKNLNGKNEPEIFGLQVIGNENDEVEGFVDKLLIGATELSVDEIVDSIHNLGGLAIASHIDRESYSVIGQLGFIPPTLRFDALEISGNITIDEAQKRFSEHSSIPFVRGSDAHSIEEIGKYYCEFFIEAPNIEEISKALKKINGRTFSIN